jgi:hypothetical protein
MLNMALFEFREQAFAEYPAYINLPEDVACK